MIKKIYILTCVLAMMLVTACSTDDITDEQGGVYAISFDLSTANQTRSAESHLYDYVKDFRVYCIDGDYSGSTFNVDETVMENWVVWNQENTNSSQTNTNSWEYVGSYTASEAGASNSSLTPAEKTAISTNQLVRNWDTAKAHYIFYALAKADRGSFIRSDNTFTATFSLTDNDANAAYTFYADPVDVVPANYGKAVKLTFHRLYPQICIGFYETIPGYVVRDVQFYATSEATTPGDNVVLLGSMPTEETATYSCTGKTGTLSYNGVTTGNVTVGGLTYAGGVSENLLNTSEGYYLNQSSTAPTYTPYKYVLPGNSNPITIKCDYKLVANDHAAVDDNEVIEVKGATATIPKEYCSWQPGYVYTYVFKISENTSGQTGSGYAGLYPITFDAEAYSETADGSSVEKEIK